VSKTGANTNRFNLQLRKLDLGFKANGVQE
jgi:hypothetical protein